MSNNSRPVPTNPVSTEPKTKNPDGTPTFYRGDSSSSSRQPDSPSPRQPDSSSSRQPDSRNAASMAVNAETDKMDLVYQTIQLDRQKCIVKGRFTCGNEELYALEGSQPMTGYDGRCPKCCTFHTYFDKPSHGFYASVKSIHDKVNKDKLYDERLKGPKEINELPIVKENLPPLDHPILGRNKGIQGDSNSCYMDSTIFCMFAYSNVFDSLLHMKVENKAAEKVQRLLRENIVNVLRGESGSVERDALFHLREKLSKATGDTSFKEMEKDPSEFLRALEGLFHYAPLKTIPPNQPPNETGSNITTNIMWEMFDANPQNLISTKIAGIFRNSLSEIPAKLATIPPFLILVAPRHARSQRSYRYIIPDPQITLDNTIVQYVCLKCKQTNHDSEQSREFYFCDGCYSKESSSISTPPTDTTVICYCNGCVEKLHKASSKEELLEHHPKQLRRVSYKLNLFAILCIEATHYVAFVKCHKSDHQHEWIFFDSMSDRIHNEKNVSCVTSVPNFDRWINEAENNANFFEDLDRRRKQGRPTSHAFNEDEMRQLRLFRDGAFFFYENSDGNYQ